MMDEPSDATLRDWLLGKLPPAVSERLEERLFAEAGFAERAQAVETDLLDDLARGHLDPDDRARAQRLFTATGKDRLRLRIALALADMRASAGARRLRAPAVSTRSPPRRRWRAWAGVALAASLAFAAVGLRLHRPAAPGPAAAADATISLLATTARGLDGSEEIRVAPTAAMVRVQAEVDADDPQTRYELRVLAGARTLFRAGDLAVREAGPYRFVEARVPASLLSGERHVQVVAAGADAATTWTLRVRRE